MRSVACASIIIALLAIGCSENVPQRPLAGSVTYHNPQYGLIFSLPSGWRGFAVIRQQWEGETYLPAEDKDAVIARGPILVLRHPRWSAAEPHQDIPILVFTTAQWNADQQGEFSCFAGGFEDEISHNAQ